MMSLQLRSSQGTRDTCEPPVVYWRPFTLPLRDLGPRQANLVLERLCSNCNGAAYMPVVISQMCNACAGSGRELLEDQEVACSVCDGACFMPTEEMQQCERCDGTGLELTAAGQRLLTLHGRQLRAFVKRWRDWRVAS
jgi:DnaJ-class molecular chaperone